MKLFETRGIEEVSLNAIAREANISKANVYRYFESREELFLHLTLDGLAEWSEDFVKRVTPLAGTADEVAFAEIYADVHLSHPRYGRLSAIVSTVLERNVSADAVYRYKMAYHDQLQPIVAVTSAVFPDFGPDEILQILQVGYFVAVGMWPTAHPPAAVQEALERPELQGFCVDFRRDFARLVTMTIRGLKHS